MNYNLLDGWFKFDVGEGAFYAVFGFLFVFIGITVLIGILMLVGKIMQIQKKKADEKAQRAAEERQKELAEAMTASQPVQEDGIPAEVVAAITAALAIYCEQEKTKCDFVVKRIRKI